MRTLIGILLIIIGILVIVFGDIFLLITTILDLIQNGTTNLFWDIIKIIFREIIAGVIGFIVILIGVLTIKY